MGRGAWVGRCVEWGEVKRGVLLRLFSKWVWCGAWCGIWGEVWGVVLGVE